MKNLSVVFFTNSRECHTELINMLGSVCDLKICSYLSDSWSSIDFYSNKNVAFVIDEIPNTPAVSKDAVWILSKLTEDGIFSEIPVLFTNFDALYSFESRGFTSFASDVFPVPFDFETARRRFDNICEIRQLKLQILNLTQIHTKRILNQANKLKEQNDKMKNINFELVELLVAAIESRDVESGQHIKRIRFFTKALLDRVVERCPEYNITPEQAEYIYYASSVHDIGKISIPDAIMLKPARLTKEEFDIMKTHTTRGAELLNMLDDISDSNPYFKYCQEVCLNHHERWDGKGYPRGLRGDETPISAQIVAVCDCYDALTSNRPYKKAISHEDAVDMIFSGACGMFSPKLMECFRDALSEFAKIENEFRNTTTYDVPDAEAAQTYIKFNTKTESENLSDDVRVILDSFDMLFTADIVNDRFDIVKGSWTDYMPYIPKNFAEFVTQCAKVCHPDDIARYDARFNLETFNSLLAEGRTKTRVEFRTLKNDVELLVIGSMVFIPAEDKTVSKIYGAFNIYKEDEVLADIKRGFGVTDALTGLTLQNRFVLDVDDYIKRNPKSNCLIIYIDIDNMSFINGAFGYEYGNALVKEVAAKLRGIKSKNTIIGKGPSDKFYMFVENINHQSEAILFVEKVHHLLRKNYKTTTESGVFTATMGISRYPDDGKSCKRLLGAAEYASTVAKLNGKGAYSFYNAGMRSSLILPPNSSGGYSTVKSDGIEPRFTPVFDAETGDIVSYDYVPFTVYDNEINVNPEIFYEINRNSPGKKNKSILALKSILFFLIGLRSAGKPQPPISIYTLFTADDIPSLSQELRDFTNNNDCSGLDVSIMFPQEFIDEISIRRLQTFAKFVKDIGFSLGLYLVGSKYIHNNCYFANSFDRYVFATDFIEYSISKGCPVQYVIDTLNNIKPYINHITIPGTSTCVNAKKFLEMGVVPFSVTGSVLVGSEDLIEDYERRTKHSVTTGLAKVSAVSELDPLLFYLDLVKGDCVYGIYDINSDRIALSANVNRVFGFDIFFHIDKSGKTVRFRNLIHPEDIDYVLAELAKIRISLGMSRFKARLIADQHGCKFKTYELLCNCIVDDKGVPVRYHMMFIPYSE